MPDRLWNPALASHRFASDDLDEVRAYMDGHNGAHWRHARRPGAVGFAFWLREGAAVRLAGCEMAAAQTIRGGVGSVTVHVTLAGRTAYRIGRREVVSLPAGYVILPAGREMTLEAIGLRRLAIQLPEGEGDAPHLASVCSRPLPERTLAALRRALDSLALASARPGAPSRLVRAQAELRLADWMRSLLPRPEERRRRPRIAPERVRAIEEWIDAHVSEPLSLSRLCEQAGVGGRCLQLAFAAQRQQSPMSFVAERRLVAAHHALERGEYGSVTAVAAAYGFDHPGRFATAYRRLFGLAPSEMIRRAAARC